MGLSTSAKEIARHHGGKSASIVEVSHVFLSPQDVAAAHALVMLREAPLLRWQCYHWLLRCEKILVFCKIVPLQIRDLARIVS